MELTAQVTSLELSKRLKELGVKQESLYYWQQIGTRKATLVQNQNTGNWDANDNANWYAAFTVAELGEILSRATTAAALRAYGHVFNVPHTSITTIEGLVRCMEAPDIGALMLIYLLENNLITLPS